MSLFLHLNENLVIQLKTYSKALYQEVYEKLQNYSLLYSETSFKIIPSDKLKSEKYNSEQQNQKEWRYSPNHKFVLTNELGTKVVFSPDIHLDYISRKRTRQGFNLYLEHINSTTETSVQFKFITEDDSNELRQVIKLKVNTYKELKENLISNNPNMLNFNMQVINEFSEFFFLKSEAEFDLIKSLYLDSQVKFNIILKKPQKHLFLYQKEKKITLDYFENHEIFLYNLYETHKITRQDILDPNLRNPAIYYSIARNSEIVILDIDKLPLEKFTKCKCGGKQIYDQCTIPSCPF